MNVRRGLSRIAYVSGRAYWAFGALIIGWVWTEGMKRWDTEAYLHVWEWSQFWDAAEGAGEAAIWVAIAYLVLWWMYRGVRWVLLGFMEQEQP